ncbi:MAG TPA: hypothetical protein VGN96_00235 [Roseococcus sp.]|jgi:hypothetical protein|nr:hypothetical protein [Roseococcus sp.]
MEYLTQVATAALAALAAVLLPAARAALRAAAEAAAERVLLDLQARLGGGASRVAGEIMAQAQAEGLASVPPALIDQGAAMLKSRYADTVARANIPDGTLAGMIVGELGKLGASVLRR